MNRTSSYGSEQDRISIPPLYTCVWAVLSKLCMNDWVPQYSLDNMFTSRGKSFACIDLIPSSTRRYVFEKTKLLCPTYMSNVVIVSRFPWWSIWTNTTLSPHHHKHFPYATHTSNTWPCFKSCDITFVANFSTQNSRPSGMPALPLYSSLRLRVFLLIKLIWIYRKFGSYFPSWYKFLEDECSWY